MGNTAACRPDGSDSDVSMTATEGRYLMKRIAAIVLLAVTAALLLELVPRDGSSRFRKYDPEITRTSFAPEDLFRPGDTFSMETCPGSFTLWPYMNCGCTLDYSVTVELYDPVSMEAVVTVTRAAP